MAGLQLRPEGGMREAILVCSAAGVAHFSLGADPKHEATRDSVPAGGGSWHTHVREEEGRCHPHPGQEAVTPGPN